MFSHPFVTWGSFSRTCLHVQTSPLCAVSGTQRWHFWKGLCGWVGGCCVCAIRAGVERSEGEGRGVHGRSEVSLPFRVTSSCQECTSPARTDHVLDAPTLFLTRQGGSVAGFREWPWSARRLQPLSLGPRALLALWRPPSALTRTPLLQWDYNWFIGREKAQDKHFWTGRHPEASKCKSKANCAIIKWSYWSLAK